MKKFKLVNINIKGGNKITNTIKNIKPKQEGNIKPKQEENIAVIEGKESLSHMEPSHMTVYTIPAGTILYHGSVLKETFNPTDIKLGEDSLVSYFSESPILASSHIMECSLYPNKTGYIHKFRVKKDIDNIIILSQYDRNGEFDDKHIENKFCKGDRMYNGVGFFIKKRDVNDFKFEDKLKSEIVTKGEIVQEKQEGGKYNDSSSSSSIDFTSSEESSYHDSDDDSSEISLSSDSSDGKIKKTKKMKGGQQQCEDEKCSYQIPKGEEEHASEFALCNPNFWLEYISSQRCIAYRKLSDEYNFNN